MDYERREQFEEEGAHFESFYYLTFVWMPPAEDSSRAESWLHEGQSREGLDGKELLKGFTDRTDRILQLVEGFVPEAVWLDDEETLTYLHACITATVTVWDEDAGAAAEKLRLVEKVIEGRDFTCIVETVNAIETSDQQMIAGAQQRWQDSLSAFQHALTLGAGAVQNLPNTQAQTSSLLSSSQSSVGILQVTQAGNQLAAVQTRQLADLTALLAAQGRAQALEQARKAEAEGQAQEQLRRFLSNSHGYPPQTIQMFHD